MDWQRLSRAGWNLSVAPDLGMAATDRILEAIDDPAQRALCRRSRHARTYRVTGADGEAMLYVKVYDVPRGWARLKSGLRGGRAANAVRQTRRLTAAGFGVAPVVARGHHRASGERFNASAASEGESLPDWLAGPAGADRAVRRGVFAGLGREVARLHRMGFIHGDLTPYNVFVIADGQPRFVLIDHDRTRMAIPLGRRRRRLRNLVQLGRFSLPHLGPSGRMAVLRAYIEELRPARPREMMREALRMLTARIVLDRSKGRPDGG